MKGQIGILNVGAGDTKLSFDKSNPAERDRAAKIVTDMLRRGYAIMVEAGKDEKGEPLYRRAHAFDPETCEYLIFGESTDATEQPAGIEPPAAPGPRARGRKAGSTRRVPADSTHAVSVARSAGG